MSEPLNAQLSAFIDGELPPAEGDLFARQVSADRTVRAAASRYYLMGEAIRAERSPVRMGFCSRVSAAIAGEQLPAGDGIADVKAARRVPRILAWWKPIAGVAMAAGVALVAILVVRDQQSERKAPEIAQAGIARAGESTATGATVTARPLESGARSAGSGESSIYVIPPNVGVVSSPLTRAQLASYVFAHSEYSSLPGRRNVVSDAAGQDDAAEEAPVEAPKP
ncbi:MAG TPA: sigma-E factor negative regulatory protein [Steroidobacteraceae bacterium]|nr:sigma-E factor negative regulatory protein [Steroidobacteraceae bacterium]